VNPRNGRRKGTHPGLFAKNQAEGHAVVVRPGRPCQRCDRLPSASGLVHCLERYERDCRLPLRKEARPSLAKKSRGSRETRRNPSFRVGFERCLLIRMAGGIGESGRRVAQTARRRSLTRLEIAAVLDCDFVPRSPPRHDGSFPLRLVRSEATRGHQDTSRAGPDPKRSRIRPEFFGTALLHYFKGCGRTGTPKQARAAGAVRSHPEGHLPAASLLP
jgi:hypothetical protein